ncbi:hypothetical protein ACFQ3W_12200 [Paenibacillus puldeungensis]|uniref:Uncharacterized protein n=1 Tax=Paenibacillus puldeungensis TaxID=696536 RepID=A0ABW3RX33_9BACL
MRQSVKSRDWQCFPAMSAGDRNEARMLSRAAYPEQFELMQREVKPSAEWLPRPGS